MRPDSVYSLVVPFIRSVHAMTAMYTQIRYNMYGFLSVVYAFGVSI